jgi:hypothetical protein
LLSAFFSAKLAVEQIFTYRELAVRAGYRDEISAAAGVYAVFTHQTGHFLMAYPFAIEAAKLFPHPGAAIPPMMLENNIPNEPG